MSTIIALPQQDEITIDMMDHGGVSIDQRSSNDGTTSGVWTANSQASTLLAQAILDAVARYEASFCEAPPVEMEKAS